MGSLHIESLYIYIYIYKERSHLREHEVLPPLVHRFKTIPLSITNISTLCLLNKHQLKDNDFIFLDTSFQNYFFLFRLSPLVLLILYIPLPRVFYIILTQMHIWDSPNYKGCKRLVVLLRRLEVIMGFWELWLDMGLSLFEIFGVGAFVLGLGWCVTGFLLTRWSHKEP